MMTWVTWVCKKLYETRAKNLRVFGIFLDFITNAEDICERRGK